MFNRTCFPAILAFVFTLTTSCGSGGKGGKSQPAAPTSSAIELAFDAAAAKFSIPKRVLMAVGFQASNLNPKAASAPYFQIEGDSTKRSLGFPMTETAFGLTRKSLGLTSMSESEDLAVQINAYAKWLRSRVENRKGLKADAEAPNDVFLWLWEISGIQIATERNVRTIWVRDMMNILNSGKLWQDPATGERLELKAQNPAIDDVILEPQYQALLRIDDDLSDINSARRLELVGRGINTLENRPRRVEVIHCPLSLSACLGLQDQSVDSKVRLGAHYVVPQDDTIIPRPLQIFDHERRVSLTSADGTVKDVSDAVIIMLVGNSGRYVDGIRVSADPTWFTSWQLRKLGAVAKGVCANLAERYADVSYRRCLSNDPREGILFHEKGERLSYRWGDIPDFDKSVFSTYISNRDANIQGEVAFEVVGKIATFTAGQDIALLTKFAPGTSWIRLQRAVRCKNQQLVWDTVRTDPIRDVSQWPMTISIWDAGPNHNGQQFLRVLIFGDQNQLVGWAIKDLYIEKFDNDFNPPSEACI